MDLFEHLLGKWKEASPPPIEPLPPPTVEDFVAFCREELARNPPITSALVGNAFGVTLQDGTTLKLWAGLQDVPQPTAFAPLTGTQPLAFNPMAPSVTVPITKGA